MTGNQTAYSNESQSLTLRGLCLLLVSTLGLPVEAGVLKSELLISAGLQKPIYAAAPAGDFDNLYIAQQRTAAISRLNLNTLAITTMLDLTNPDPVTGPESGLNGFALHPDFANNGKVYVNLSGDPSGDIKILEYTRSTTDPNVFDPNSEREILTVPNPSLSHFGGWIGFSPVDGYLYLGMGDGGNVPPTATKGINAQNVNSLQGKILRIDVDGEDYYPEDDSRNYAIPDDNPFAAGGGAPEVFALGLRHPFRNGFDRETGDLYIADVGSEHFEEINFLPAGTDGGQNYGWRPLEGFIDHPSWPDPAPPDAIFPITVYPNPPAAAVIGGYVYRGENIRLRQEDPVLLAL
jgi:glucose/arabinose dehydrogenase